jgi:uncharacterized protein (DUF2141 family)
MVNRIIFAALCLLPCGLHAATLTLTATGLKPVGNFVLAVFDNEKSWRSNSGPVATSQVPVASDGPTTVVLTLPPGRYAVMAFHDRNADTKLNTSFVGMPTEVYAFSRDARGVFGAPKWEAASFQLEADTAMPLRLR